MLNNKYWYASNPFFQAGFGLPNCTCYCWGRRYEITGEPPETSLGNADTWYDFAVSSGQSVGQVPQLGAIAVWKYSGSQASEGGHVAIVEVVSNDSSGNITTSNSAYGGSYFYTQNLSPPYEWGIFTQFQGFIYLDCSPEPPKPIKKNKMPVWMYLLPF